MFGFGKKNITEKMMYGFVVEVGMFQSWTLERKKLDLSSIELKKIFEGILKRERIEYSSDELMMMVNMAIANTNFELMLEMRQKTRFDQQVIGFCKSINLEEKYYS
jgi:hypothetical protein